MYCECNSQQATKVLSEHKPYPKFTTFLVPGYLVKYIEGQVRPPI